MSVRRATPRRRHRRLLPLSPGEAPLCFAAPQRATYLHSLFNHPPGAAGTAWASYGHPGACRGFHDRLRSPHVLSARPPVAKSGGRAMKSPFPNLPPVILASASPRRVELLGQLGLAFDVIPAEVEELHQEHMTVREVSLLNASRKARSVAKRFPDHLVVGADTLVALGTRLYGKPVDEADAFRMLRELAGQTHQVVTGVCLQHRRGHREQLFAEVTAVTFRPLADEQIEAYLTATRPFDKAGAYAIQERGGDLVANVEGSYSNVVGLPLERLRRELAAWVD